jgi:hypothetical protein
MGGEFSIYMLGLGWFVTTVTYQWVITKYRLIPEDLLDVGLLGPGESLLVYTVRSNALFTDPQSVTINAVATSLPKTYVEGSRSVYTSADGNVEMVVEHVRQGARKRSTIRLNQKKVAADPLLAERNVPTNQAVYVVLNAPTNGLFTNSEQKYLLDALADFLKASSGANATKFVAGES